MSEFEQIREALSLTLDQMAEALGASHATVHRWESAPDTRSGRQALEAAKALYKKRTKQEWKAKEAGAPAGGPYVTEKDFAEWRGYWRGGMEGVLERLKSLEDQVQKLRQQAESK